MSTQEFALRMNISQKELYERIKDGRVLQPTKDGRKNYWLNSYVTSCITGSTETEKDYKRQYENQKTR